MQGFGRGEGCVSFLPVMAQERGRMEINVLRFPAGDGL